MAGGDQWSKPEVGRVQGDGRQHDPGIGDRPRPVRADVVPHEEAIPADGFRFMGQSGHAARIGKLRADIGDGQSILHKRLPAFGLTSVL